MMVHRVHGRKLCPTVATMSNGSIADISPIRRTDPRIDRTRHAVIDAAAIVLTGEGAGAVTHQRIAEVSGVGRATLYRHWPTAADLLYDVLSEVDQALLRPGEGPLIDWLRAELGRASIEMAQPAAVQFVSVLIARAGRDPGAAELRRRIIDRNVLHLATAVARASERGEIVGDPEPHELLAQLLGPILMRVIIEGRPASEEFVNGVIDVAMAPWLANSETT
jgi:AcrR family transcriptional regulator